MCNQLKVACFKLRHFWLLTLALPGMVGIGFSYGYIKLADVGYDIYDAFRETCSDTSFAFLLVLVSAWFIGSDFSNRTIHHEITLGYGRWSILLIRELCAYLSAAVLHVAYVVFTMLGTGSITGFSGRGFGPQDVLWCIVILLQLAALQSITVLITFVCAKAAAAIAASVCFAFITCNLLRNYFDGPVFTKSCFCFARNHDYETLIPAGIAAVLTWMAVSALTYVIFRRREIK